MVAKARALLGKPIVLQLDELSMGLAPRITDVISDAATSVLPILLVEQNGTGALSVADRAYVLELGKIVLRDSGHDLTGHPDVQRNSFGR